MIYDREKIANRIRNERKALDLSQDTFAERLGYSKPTVVKWEKSNGDNTIPTYDQLVDMANLFNCEIGYILCEYDTRFRESTDIMKSIGLSENTVNYLISLVNKENERKEKIRPEFRHFYESPLLKLIDYCIPLFSSIVKNVETIIADRYTKELYEKSGIFSPLSKIYECVQKHAEFSWFGEHSNELLFYDVLYELFLENASAFDYEDIKIAESFGIKDDLNYLCNNASELSNGVLPENLTVQHIDNIIKKVTSEDISTYSSTYSKDPADNEPDDWDCYQQAYRRLERLSADNKLQQFIISDTFMDIVKSYIEKEVKEKTK